MKKITTIQKCCQSLAISFSVLVAASVLPHQANAANPNSNSQTQDNFASSAKEPLVGYSDKQSKHNRLEKKQSTQGHCKNSGAFCW